MHRKLSSVTAHAAANAALHTSTPTSKQVLSMLSLANGGHVCRWSVADKILPGQQASGQGSCRRETLGGGRHLWHVAVSGKHVCRHHCRVKQQQEYAETRHSTNTLFLTPAEAVNNQNGRRRGCKTLCTIATVKSNLSVHISRVMVNITGLGCCVALVILATHAPACRSWVTITRSMCRCHRHRAQKYSVCTSQFRSRVPRPPLMNSLKNVECPTHTITLCGWSCKSFRKSPTRA